MSIEDKVIMSLWIGLTRNADGTFSSSKFWSGVAYLVTSGVIITLTFRDAMSAEYLLIYLAATTTSRGLQSYLKMKSGHHTDKN